MEITIKPNIHTTPVFKKLQAANTRFVLNYGGTGSGKSFAAAQKEVLKALTNPGIKTLVIRKVGSTLRDSVIPSFLARICELTIPEHFHYNKSDRTLTHTSGSQIIFRGLDDPDKLKSFEGLQRILVEEAAELEFEDYLELNRRARGRSDIQITLCFNPVHEEHWLKKHFFDSAVEDCTILHSTYLDNPYLTEVDKQQIEQLQRYDNNQYRIYALGEWGLLQNDQAWLHAFSRERHTAPTIPYMPNYPVYLSFDFNRQPATCIAAQMSPGHKQSHSFIHIIKEFSADVQLSELCARIRATFPAALLYVTGDASGHKGDVGYADRHSTCYRMIQQYLNLTNRRMKLHKRNLPHSDSRQLLNTLFTNHPRLLLSTAGCPQLISDCIIARVDEDSPRPGTLKKDRNTYKMDLFDCLRYLCQAWLPNYDGLTVNTKITLKNGKLIPTQYATDIQFITPD
jgi:phage terminase large subunit